MEGELQFGLESMEQKLESLFHNSQIDTGEIIDHILQGELTGALKVITDSIAEAFYANLDEVRLIFVSLLLLGVTGAVCVRFSELFEKYHLGELSFYFIYLSQAMILMKTYYALSLKAEETLCNILVFIKLLCPTYLMAVAASTGTVTAGAGYEMVLMLIYGVEELFRGILLPMVRVFFLITLLNGICLPKRLDFVTGLIKTGIVWVMRGTIGILGGIELLQGILTPTLDGIQEGVIRRAVKVIPGVGNSAEGIIEITLGCSGALKNCMGVLLPVFLLLLCAIPLFKLLLFAFVLKFAAAFVELIGSRDMAVAIDQTGETSLLLFKIVGCAMLLFMSVITVTCVSLKRF